MRRDAIFYQIFQRFPTLFFDLVGQYPDQVRDYRFESVEVKEPSFRIDGVFLPPDSAAPKVVFFVEVQFQKDQSLYHRFFAEIFLYLYRNQGRYDNWTGVLIFPRRALEPDNSVIHRTLLHSSQVQCLYLDELDNTATQPIGISLVQLMVLDEAETIEQARQLIARSQQEETATLSRREIIDIVATIAVYKFAQLSRAEVEAMLGLNVEQTRVYQEAREEGRQEGRQEGLTEGELRGKLAAIPLLVKAGIGTEEIAAQLGLELATVQQVITQQSAQ